MSNYPPPQGYPQQNYPQEGYAPQQQRSGCGGCLGKLLILLGIIFALILAMCCGGIFYMKSYVANSVTQQPGEVQKISDEIISINVPAPLEPVAGGRFPVPWVGTTFGQFALYSDKNHKGVLVLASFGEALPPQYRDQLLQSMESGQFQSGPPDNNQSHEDLKDAKKTHRERTIQGAKAVFDITEGVGVQSNKKKIRVQGEFKGKTGPAMLILDVEEDAISLDQVQKMIDSMQ